jgi:mono/diheme cytochrome c family protein
MKALVLLCSLVAAAAMTVAGAAQPAAPAPLPRLLSETGLFEAGSGTVRADVIAFAPQYPLWSDGTRKQRWIRLPAGRAIDASQPDAWQFPVGTRLWKEFSFGRRIETRYIERLADGSWRFASYAWNADGIDAVLVPEDGAIVAAAGAPGGRYSVPSRNDCLACHEGPAVPVLGFSALQLSPDRDPLAPHADPARREDADLRSLVAQGRLVNLPPPLLATPPRIRARTPTERAALGYLHANCGHCHNAAGALDGLQLALAQYADSGSDSVEQTLRSLLGHSSRFRPHGAASAQRVAHDGSGHMLTLRMKTANPLARMPPLGVQVVDTEGVTLVERWITSDLQRPHDLQLSRGDLR